MQVTENALGQAAPDLRFFHTTTVGIAGRTVGALRHGMVGQPGWELFGPWEDREAVLEALQPKRRDDGETMKWSSVCAEQAQGVKPGDPTFTAWVRLAATPERVVWGSDWPHPTEADKPDDAVLFDLLNTWAPDEATRQRILVENPAKLYGFPK